MSKSERKYGSRDRPNFGLGALVFLGLLALNMLNDHYGWRTFSPEVAEMIPYIKALLVLCILSCVFGIWFERYCNKKEKERDAKESR